MITTSLHARKAQSVKTQMIRRHNGLHGSVARAQLTMTDILQVQTTTNESKALAAEIDGLLMKLRISLAKRVGP